MTAPINRALIHEHLSPVICKECGSSFCRCMARMPHRKVSYCSDPCCDAAMKQEGPARNKRYRQNNLEKRQVSNRAWRALHREEIQQKNREYREKHHEELQAANKIYRANTPTLNARRRELRALRGEEIRARDRAYYAANREVRLVKGRLYGKAARIRGGTTYRRKKTLYARLYRAAHPEIQAARDALRRARKKAAPIRDLTAKQWKTIKELYGHRCVYCGRKMHRLTQDHITPLSKGGSHTYTNVVPACVSCNSQKGNRAPLRPVQPLLLLGA